jgi:hypothetical protein
VSYGEHDRSVEASMKSLIAAFWLMSLAWQVVAQAAPAHDPARIAGVVDGLVVQAMETHNAPGAVVAVVGPQGLIHAGSHGIARLTPEETPVTAETLFRLASISKTLRLHRGHAAGGTGRTGSRRSRQRPSARGPAAP